MAAIKRISSDMLCTATIALMAPIPEPATMVLMTAGLFGKGGRLRKPVKDKRLAGYGRAVALD